MRKHGLRCCPVFICLFVCDICVLYPDTEDITQLLSRPGSPIISAFLTPSIGTQPQRGTPLVGAQNTWGWEKFVIFD